MEGCGKARDGRRWESCERQTGFLDGTVQMNSRRVVPRSISPKALDIACHSLGKSPRWGGGGNAGSGGGDLLQAQELFPDVSEGGLRGEVGCYGSQVAVETNRTELCLKSVRCILSRT